MANRIYPMGMLLFSVLFLCIPGVLFNNFASSNLVQPGAPAAGVPNSGLVCNGGTPSGYQADDTCHSPIPEGCQATYPNLTPCALRGSTIDFLNANSPFTLALNDFTSGDIFGIFTNLNAGGSTAATSHGPFDYSGGGSFTTGTCAGKFTSATNRALSFSITSCTQTTSDNANITQSSPNTAFVPYSPQTVTNWNVNTFGKTLTTPFYNWKSNSSYTFFCAPQVTFNASSTVGYTWYGCDLYYPLKSGATVSPYITPIFSVLVAFPTGNIYNDPVSVNVYTHVYVYVQAESWETAACLLSYLEPQPQYGGPFSSPQCTNFLGNLKTAYSNGASTLELGWFSPILTFFIGIAVFLIGIGMGLTGSGSLFGAVTAGGGIDFNEQGTRLAQSVGLGLILFSPLYSEFSTWFTQGYLPYGLDGPTGVISLMILATFFLATFWLAISLDD